MQEFFHSWFSAGLEGEQALNASPRQRAGCWRVGERERGFRVLLLTGRKKPKATINVDDAVPEHGSGSYQPTSGGPLHRQDMIDAAQAERQVERPLTAFH